MGINFGNLVEDSRSVAIEVGNSDVVNITYSPRALSPASMQRLQERLNKGEDTDPYAVAEMFCSIVTDWDVYGPVSDEDGNVLVHEGQRVPLEPHYVAELPASVISFLMEKVGEDSAPKSRKSKR